jgi:hypothetical protein
MLISIMRKAKRRIMCKTIPERREKYFHFLTKGLRTTREKVRWEGWSGEKFLPFFCHTIRKK